MLQDRRKPEDPFQRTGQVDLFALKQVVQDVTNAATEISIDEARQMCRELW
jgi:hypothetical protein